MGLFALYRYLSIYGVDNNAIFMSVYYDYCHIKFVTIGQYLTKLDIRTHAARTYIYTHTHTRTETEIFGFSECLTTTFLHTHHSLLAKLCRWRWLMRMRLAWKKSQNTLDTLIRLHQNETRSTGSVGKGLDYQLCHYRELQTRERAG